MYHNRFKSARKILLALIFWLLAWQLTATIIRMELLLPTPFSVIKSLGNMIFTEEFWMSAVLSLSRIFTGMLVGTALGSLLAFLTHFFRLADTILTPAIQVLRATPVVSFILLVYLWVSRANIPGLISAMMVLPVIWSNLTAGLSAVDPQLLELSHAYRFSRFKTLKLIYLPSLRPYFTPALLNAFGLAWKSGIAAEVICPPKYAIGTEIKQARDALESPELFAWTLIIIVLSLSLEHLLRTALKDRRLSTT